MDAESAREFLLQLPHVVETQQWGDNLVFWVGDKAIGGKMFCLLDLGSGVSKGVASFAAGPARSPDLLERDGLKPAPYLARAHWVAAERWGALRHAEWQDELRGAYEYIESRLPKRVRAALALAARDREKLIRERRAALSVRGK